VLRGLLHGGRRPGRRRPCSTSAPAGYLCPPGDWLAGGGPPSGAWCKCPTPHRVQGKVLPTRGASAGSSFRWSWTYTLTPWRAWQSRRPPRPRRRPPSPAPAPAPRTPRRRPRRPAPSRRPRPRPARAPRRGRRGRRPAGARRTSTSSRASSCTRAPRLRGTTTPTSRRARARPLGHAGALKWRQSRLPAVPRSVVKPGRGTSQCKQAVVGCFMSIGIPGYGLWMGRMARGA